MFTESLQLRTDDGSTADKGTWLRYLLAWGLARMRRSDQRLPIDALSDRALADIGLNRWDIEVADARDRLF